MTPIRSLVAVACGTLILSLVACTGSRPEGDDADDEPTGPTITAPEADLKALADGNNQFAIELYKKLAAKTDGNIVLSPYSISAALAMTYAGARGETAEQMRQTLHFTLPPDRLHPAFGALTQQLQANGKAKPFELNIANALWGQKGVPFRPEFLELTQRNYDGGFQTADFARDLEGSRQAINRWVAERTQGRIEELLLKGDIKPITVLILTNAIYFKGDWERAFPENQTRDEAFESAAGVRATVSMMRSKPEKFRYYAAPDYHMVELPYRGNRVSMVFILPTKRFELAEVERSLTADKLEASLVKLSERPGTVVVPRFKSKTRFNHSMKASLKELGMPLAFSFSADFSGMIDSPELLIDNVIHEAVIEVNESGTVATGTTSVIMVPRSGASSFTFRADQPFLFLIRERDSGSILFLGRFKTPK
jgi:serpin B